MITGGAFAAWAFLLAGGLAIAASDWPAGGKSFLAWSAVGLLAVLGLLFAYWANSIRSLAYTIDRHAIIISWGPHRHVIPIASIQRLVPGRTLDEARVQGLNWWGCHIGVAFVRRIGTTFVYSTHSSPDEIVYIVTNDEAFALTVLDQAAFAEEVQARAAMGPASAAHAIAATTGLAAWSFWEDRVAVAMAALLVVATALPAAYLSWQYPGLPPVIQLDFPALDGVVRVGNKRELLEIVWLGLGVGAANLGLGLATHQWERAASVWLLASGAMIQGVLLLAAMVAVRQA